MTFYHIINSIIAALFFICYFYQFIYTAAALFRGKAGKNEFRLHNYAVLIAARNEETVIAALIESIKKQIYPGELITVFVVADNCTDRTAVVAKNCGAVVYERNNPTLVGKGYALDFLLKRIGEDYPENYFDGYFVFDADNVLEPDYIYEMNRVFSQGYRVVTGYRNSKNYGDNWISAGYGLWFLRESQSLNKARYILGTSCNISGTGFVFSNEIVKRMGGWKYFLLTEDLEFTADHVIKGEKIGYCENAVLYDEQPTGMAQSVRQRTRWCKGYFQVLAKHGAELVRGAFIDGNFSCYDMLMSMTPAFVLSLAGVIANVIWMITSIISGAGIAALIFEIVVGIFKGYLMFFILGLITTLTEWGRIETSAAKKILYTFTFPLFMFTYLPISIGAIFAKAEWKPIFHGKSYSLSQSKSRN